MKVKQMEADLFCIRCKEEIEHNITYVNDRIASVKCLECQNAVEFDIDVSKEFYKEIYERISTKPSRITKEYREDLSNFLFSLPIRVVSKPYRILKDINVSRKIIKGYKRKNR
ncbi:bh protein [Alkalihalobacillus sp. BA299]|uniref:bh protein n=1 Tax=Alkalihalobacillus sp. BA299 TaxID=2815938 RepID=UPI001ADACDF7|nr:bh protein [Alkalihalobacillus sp. BA299]